MKLDLEKMRKVDEITVTDGRKLKVRNVYMSTDGIMIVAKGSTSGNVDQNIPVSKVTDHKLKEGV